MRQLQNYKLGREWRPGNYAESLYLSYGGMHISLSAGLSDTVSVYHDKEYIYTVVENHSLGYIGLEVVDKVIGELAGEFFDRYNECGYLDMARYPTKIRAMLEHIF